MTFDQQDKVGMLDSHEITATVFDLNGIFVEENDSRLAKQYAQHPVTAIVSFARRPRVAGDPYSTGDSRTTNMSNPIRSIKKSKAKPSPDGSLEEFEASWYNDECTFEDGKALLSANFFDAQQETYDVMVHLVKDSEPIPLGVAKLVLKATDLEDGCAFQINLSLRTLFRRIKSTKDTERNDVGDNTTGETVLSFALSNGYTYGLSNNAVLRLRLDVETISCSSSEDESASEQKIQDESQRASNDTNPSAMIASEDSKINGLDHTPKRAKNVRDKSSPTKLSNSNLTGIDYHGNVDVKELLRKSTSDKMVNISPAMAREKHLQRLEKLKKKHSVKDKLHMRQQRLYELQNMDSDEDYSLNDKNDSENNAILSLAQLFMDFNPCVVKCQQRTNTSQRTGNDSRGRAQYR